MVGRLGVDRGRACSASFSSTAAHTCGSNRRAAGLRSASA
jgi:hypothetical protein